MIPKICEQKPQVVIVQVLASVRSQASASLVFMSYCIDLSASFGHSHVLRSICNRLWHAHHPQDWRGGGFAAFPKWRMDWYWAGSWYLCLQYRWVCYCSNLFELWPDSVYINPFLLALVPQVTCWIGGAIPSSRARYIGESHSAVL